MHPDREAEVLAVAGTLENTVANAEVLRANPLEPEVGVGGAELARPGERDVAELSVGEVDERGIERRAGHAGEPTYLVRVTAMSFPAWLGIGAQRSGTTWLTDLVTQHPQVGLGTNGKKEQHLLHKVGDGREPESAYLDLFPDDGVRRGDWTPQYLRHSSTPAVAARLGGGAPIFVVLRDPVERFRSAMRLAATRGKSWPYPVPITVQTWTGMYADQLDMWAAVVGRERMHVLVYETVREDPQRAVDSLWRAIGVDPVPLRDIARESSSSSRADWEWTPGLKETLQVLYRPQVQRLATDWGLDVSGWTSAS